MPPKLNIPASVTLLADQFKQLLSTIKEQAATTHQSEARRSVSPNSYTRSAGSFAKCSARFNESDDADVEAFVDNIITYKDCTNISDENALRGLSMLLESSAATWCQGIKPSSKDWQSAVNILREVYSKKLPPHVVFQELFAREQTQHEVTDIFVAKFRALIAQLPYSVAEEMQLDMVYGLLTLKIRKRLPRSEINSFKDLLNCAREIEQSFRESAFRKQERNTNQDGMQIKKLRPRCDH
ncbi:hypothetical protein Zmor_018343 [Zophobas morio]|uniref:Retrotransposon gag domain-containing protein n=1 Tax=Zophobas morio TaxID=2755281 RepID=A0AA38MCY1_9CUCU|nr:hypothetical protein Zmor_018343 [Zophobas morio]